MPYPDLNLQFPAIGSGVLAQPQTLTNPIQNPLGGGDAATIDAMAQARAKQTALQQALLRAAVLREEPLNAKGPGPFGARQGTGPMGWAVGLGDVIAGAIAKSKRQKAGEATTGAMGELSPAEQKYVNLYLANDAAAQQPYGRSPMSYVPQGSPLSLGNQ